MKSALQSLIAEPPGEIPYTSNSSVAKVRYEQLQLGMEPCFMSRKRMLCNDIDCSWRMDCRRLIAVWKR